MNEDQPQEIIQQHNLYQIPMQVEKMMEKMMIMKKRNMQTW